MIILAFCATVASILWMVFSLSGFKYKDRRVFTKDLPQDTQITDWPKISVIVPARNEEIRIEEALSTLLAQDYPNFEVIIVNDRSTDRTGEILSRITPKYSNVHVCDITALPADWMGKPHALQRGFELAQGDWIVFTDADAVWGEGVLRRTIGFAIKENVDFVSMIYEPIINSIWERLFLMAFYNFALMAWQPWNVEVRESRANLAVGQFCMLTRQVLEQISGMERLKLSIPNDVALGKAAKFNHFRCRVLWGKDIFWCRWQDGLMGLIKGVEKNFFANCKFSYLAAFLTLSLILMYNCGPLLGMFIGYKFHSLALFMINALGFFAMSVFCGLYQNQLRWRWYHLLLLPLGSLFLSAGLMWSMIQTTRQRGIRWRDSYYSKESVLEHLTSRDKWLEEEWMN